MNIVKFAIGKTTDGKTIVLSYDADAPRCGRDCDCCEYGDGTAPVDHDRDCDLITSHDGDCSCEGAHERAKDRKRVRLCLAGRCIKESQ